MVAGATQKAKKSKKQRKVGRNAEYCARYVLTKRREHNKIVKVRRHLVKFPDDMVAVAAISACKDRISGIVSR